MISDKAAHEFRRTVGQSLIGLRAGAEQSQTRSAKAAGITQAALSNYEHGIRDIPLVVYVRLLDFYHTDVGETRPYEAALPIDD